MKKYKVIVNLLILLILIPLSTMQYGCKGDTGDNGITGPGGPKLIGKISGNVILIDTNGVQPSMKNGVNVSIDGLGRSAITDSTGKWSIDSVYTGVYTITISKNNYGSTKHVNYQFIGGGTTFLANDYLSAVPNYSVSNLTYTSGISGGNTYVDIKGNISFTSNQMFGRNILLFIGNSSMVSNDPANYLDVVNAFVIDTATTFTQRITTTEFSHIGIPTGSPAYIVAYASSAAFANSSRYIDVNTGRYYYTSLNSANSGVLTINTPMDNKK